MNTLGLRSFYVYGTLLAMSEKIHWLLVDSEPEILVTLKSILEMNGYIVEAAVSVRDAKEKMSQSTFDLVITDIRLESETGGYEVIRAARSQAYKPATAILTASRSPSTGWKHVGANSLLVKPLGTEELVRQIKAVLAQHRSKTKDNVWIN